MYVESATRSSGLAGSSPKTERALQTSHLHPQPGRSAVVLWGKKPSRASCLPQEQRRIRLTWLPAPPKLCVHVLLLFHGLPATERPPLKAYPPYVIGRHGSQPAHDQQFRPGRASFIRNSSFWFTNHRTRGIIARAIQDGCS
jgi:hypothetical protein